MNAILEFLNALPGLLPLSVRVVFGLIAVDVLLGVAKAIRTKDFDLAVLAHFYESMIVPYLIGYVAFLVGAHFTLGAILPEPYGFVLSDTMIALAWAAVVGTLARSIYLNAALLYKGIPEWPPTDFGNEWKQPED